MRNRALTTGGKGIIVDVIAKGLPIIYSNSVFSKTNGYENSGVLGENCRFLQEVDGDQEAIKTLAETIKN
ncbi:hypothetical protein [Maribacter sp. ACAM166]|uniref:hypothetical protein n=1 Tax=Maribacter sp. ACAM166 TaxID=2508996 RepID=UPI0010FCF76E|nr:hypothetical protein [Maribacter sp. ACAM166]TLP77279.1 hypothetical protein ES765_13320 [Maribacter sp. ACAM166]